MDLTPRPPQKRPLWRRVVLAYYLGIAIVGALSVALGNEVGWVVKVLVAVFAPLTAYGIFVLQESVWDELRRPKSK